MSPSLIEWNLNILSALTSLRNPFFDWFFALFTYFGSEYIVILAICFLFLCKDKKSAYKIALVYFLSGLVVQALKIGFQIDRPWILAERFPAFAGNYRPLDLLGSLAGATGYSFPSGHTQTAFAFYGSLALLVKKPLAKWGLWSTALLIAFSRLYLGVHTPLDVLVSALVTLMTLLLVQLFFEKTYHNEKFDIFISLCISFVSLAVILYGGILYFQGNIEKHLVSDCIKSAACGMGFGLAYFLEKRYIRYDEQYGSVPTKILRLLFSVVCIFAFKEGIKYIGILLFQKELLTLDVLRYMLMLFFGVCLYPLLLKHIRKKKNSSMNTHEKEGTQNGTV